MNGETFITDPDFSVIFGCRSVLSLIGLATGSVGYWLMERQWDNEGSVAITSHHGDVEGGNEAQNPASSSYVHMNDSNEVIGQAVHTSGARDLVRIRTDDNKDQQYHPKQAAGDITHPIQSAAAALYYGSLTEFEATLATAFPVPKLMLIGLTLWSISFVLDPAIGGFRMYANFFNITCFLLSASIGPLLAFPMRMAILRRDIQYKKKLFFALVLILVLISIFSVADPEVDAPWYFNIFGVLFILASSVVFMSSRKMGFTWIYEGKSKPNSGIMVQNLGPLLMIFGTYLFWVGTNAIEMADLNQSYVPLWTTSPRGWCAFIAGMIFIVPGQLAMDLAFDQGSLPVSPGFRDRYVYKLNGNTFAALARNNVSRFDVEWLGRWLETPLLGSIGWFLMGLCSFMPYFQDPTFQKILTMLICFAIPPVRYGLVNPALWKSDNEAYQKWLYVYYGLMLALVIAIGMSAGIALLFSLVGAGLILAGQRKDLYDERKYGHLWLTGTPPTVNPNPQVYGLGQPLSILGWIMFCTAMSVPM